MKVPNFKPTEWAINNKISIFVLTFILFFMGLLAYIDLPKEQFPDVVVPTIYVETSYPGTSPSDIENLITRQIEKELKSIVGIKKISSNSVQDYSSITAEFNTNIDPKIAKQRVTDAVDKAKSNLPTDLDNDPIINEMDISEMPIMTINISGDINLDELKDYAEEIQDEIETLKEITRVDLIGALKKEVQINVDLSRMAANNIAFNDITNVIRGENINIGGGNLKVSNLDRTIRVVGEFKSIDDIKDITIRSSQNDPIPLRDIAEIKLTHAERDNFARMNGKPVIALNVIKRSGENLIAAADQIIDIIDNLQKNRFPSGLEIEITNDMSANTRIAIGDLINSVIIGFILVTLVLMFFMGINNAFFVGLAVPLSSALSFIVLPALDFTFNIVVTFSFLLGLGILVDNAIVVIENTYRLHTKENLPIKKAARQAAGEVFTAVLSGTLTTLAPFFPLLFWPGIMGEFMFFLPAVLIIILTASLFVAFIINPVFAIQFMKITDEKKYQKSSKKFYSISLFAILFSIVFYLVGINTLGNLILISLILIYLNKFVIQPLFIIKFQEKVIPAMIGTYEKIVTYFLQGIKPGLLIGSTILLLIIAIIGFAVNTPPVDFFPNPDPNNAMVYIETPLGTNAYFTDSVTAEVERRVYEVIGENNPIVKSVISNVGIGAGDPMNPDRSVKTHKGKVTVAFVEYAKREGENTNDYLKKIRERVTDMPGVDIVVDKESAGPPMGKPVNIEIKGDDFNKLVELSSSFKKLILDSLKIEGIENLKSNLELNKPELIVDINRDKANREGVSSGQIGSAIRNALYGEEATKFRDGEEEYPIKIRLREENRHNIDQLLNMKLTFREKTGDFRQIPISSFANVRFENNYGGINRINVERTVTLSSNVIEGYNANEINKKIQKAADEFIVPFGYSIKLTGEQEDQKETSDFLVKAFLISILLVTFILVTMFNSIVKPFMIFTTILFSVIGVLIGFSLAQMEISIVMTGVGIIALAGIVVNNGILLIDFIDVRLKDGLKIKKAIIEGGSIRFIPVILTAVSTMLGLVPLAVGLNIDFPLLFSELNPNISFGSDNTAFWKTLSWTIIFGLSFSTFLTLVVVPSMYLIQYTMKLKFNYSRYRKKGLLSSLFYMLFGRLPIFSKS